MLNIVGGTYLEYCNEPASSELFGSGLRAAVAVSKMDPQVRLATVVSKQQRRTLQGMAATYGIEVEAQDVPRTPWFGYYHSLSDPVWGDRLSADDLSISIRVEADNILRFGMLEGEPEVHGRRVVFDPQSPSSPRRFHDNGSTALELAVVANESECRQMLGAGVSVDDGVQALGQLRADVLVVKQGVRGATVLTSASVTHVPAYLTEQVWSIGSGDVFSAVFAHYWCNEGLEASSAASLASKATATYCDTRTLPVDPAALQHISFPEVNQTDLAGSAPDGGRRVYLAGPFFTMAERWVIEQARAALAGLGLAVFSPLHDVGRGESTAVAKQDLLGLEDSDVIFAILDGLDAGTLFEVGYARSLKIPVVGFAQNVTPEDLTMVTGSGCTVCDDFASAIYRTAWATNGS